MGGALADDAQGGAGRVTYHGKAVASQTGRRRGGGGREPRGTGVTLERLQDQRAREGKQRGGGEGGQGARHDPAGGAHDRESLVEAVEAGCELRSPVVDMAGEGALVAVVQPGGLDAVEGDLDHVREGVAECRHY